MGKIILFYGFLAGVLAASTTPAPVTVTTTPSTLTFTSQAGALTLPKSQKVSIKASAGKPTFTAATAGDPWLNINLNSGTLPATLAVSVNPNGLTVGMYTSSITVTVAGVTAPAVVSVSLNITAAPATLTLNPGTLTFTGTQGPMTAQTVVLSTDTAPISFKASSGASWMSVSPAIGIVFPGEQVTLTVTVDATTLSPSAVPYLGKITVVASGAAVTTKSQSVAASVIVVSSAPTITSIWPLSLPLNGGPQTITITGTNFYAATLAAVQPGATATALATTIISNSVLLAVVPASMLTVAGSLNVIVQNPAPGGSSAVITESIVSAPVILGFYNSASYANTGISPGELVTIFGTNIGPATPAPMSVVGGYVATTLSNVSVTINGVAAPILYVSENQITIQVPYEVAAGAGQPVVLTNGTFPAANATVTVVASIPGIFSADGSGLGQAAAINTSAATGAVTLNGSTNPAKIGDTVTFYLTGEGNYNASLLTGAVTTNTGFIIPPSYSPLPQISPLPTVQIGGVDASGGVSYAGVVPGSLIGVLQINVAIPTGSSTGATVPVAISIGGNSTQSNVTINIHP